METASSNNITAYASTPSIKVYCMVMQIIEFAAYELVIWSLGTDKHSCDGAIMEMAIFDDVVVADTNYFKEIVVAGIMEIAVLNRDMRRSVCKL